MFDMFHGIMAITLLVTTILCLWKKWKKKKALKHHVLPMISPNTRNTQSNPNIGNDGRNVNIVGTTGTIFIVSFAIVFILTNIMHVNGWKIGTFMEKMNTFMPLLLASFLLPGLFYLNKPGLITTIKDDLLYIIH